MHASANFGGGNVSIFRDSNLRNPVGAFGDTFGFSARLGFTLVQHSIRATGDQFISAHVGNAPQRFFANFDFSTIG